MQIESEYLSHQPVLVAACHGLAEGRILELGAGFGSTPLLHVLAATTNSELVTLESDAVWLARFSYLERPWHKMGVCGDFAYTPEYDEDWDVAVVDHAQFLMRGAAIVRLKGRAKVIIAHDSCFAHLYGYEAAFKEYAHVLNYVSVRPWTAVLSDDREAINRVFEALR